MRFLVGVAFAGLASVPVRAWHADGHGAIARLALRWAGPALPSELTSGESEVARAAAEPDLWRHPLLPALSAREAPEHYLDWELLGAAELPPERAAFEELRHRLSRSAAELGALPYALLEGTERLALCLAVLRREPGSASLTAHCRRMAGWLAHYAGDAVQPLHTTVHHDGWAFPDGTSPRSGIHRATDALFEGRALELDALQPPKDLQPFEDLWAGIVAALSESHGWVDRVDELEPDLRSSAAGESWSPQLAAFACKRLQAGGAFLARLYLTAAERSQRLDLPAWWERARARREDSGPRP